MPIVSAIEKSMSFRDYLTNKKYIYIDISNIDLLSALSAKKYQIKYEITIFLNSYITIHCVKPN